MGRECDHFIAEGNKKVIICETPNSAIIWTGFQDTDKPCIHFTPNTMHCQSQNSPLVLCPGLSSLNQYPSYKHCQRGSPTTKALPPARTDLQRPLPQHNQCTEFLIIRLHTKAKNSVCRMLPVHLLPSKLQHRGQRRPARGPGGVLVEPVSKL